MMSILLQSRPLRGTSTPTHRPTLHACAIGGMERAGKRNGNNGNHQLWQQHNQPIEIKTHAMLEQKMNYIHMNPVKAGFVSEPEHWKYSSAIDYSGGRGLLKIHGIDYRHD